jgi:threonine dehydratase
MFRLADVAHRTPVLTSRSLDEQLGARVYLKAENFQRTGSFKFRGAYNAMASLLEAERSLGVVTYSSGNHAQALALAGRLLGAPVTVVMPDDAPMLKRQATEGLGARVVTYRRGSESREELAAAITARTGAVLIPPFDHPHVIAGQGTAALELLEEVGFLDALFVCTGGGGLISGCALAARQICPRAAIIGVEPEAGDDGTRSFQSGVLQRVQNPITIADGARTEALGSLTFPLIRQLVTDMMTVTDGELVAEMRFLAERLKIVVEPTGCLALAGLRKRAADFAGQRVGVILSGGNVDMETFARLVSGGAKAA